MINSPKPEPAPIKIICNKCGNEASIILKPEQKSHTDKLKCSKCGAKGWDIAIEYLNPSETGKGEAIESMT